MLILLMVKSLTSMNNFISTINDTIKIMDTIMAEAKMVKIILNLFVKFMTGMVI